MTMPHAPTLGDLSTESQTTVASPSRTPWGWRPPLDRWCDGIADRVTHWRPADGLEMDVVGFVAAVREAARRRETWLWHPCVSRLTMLPGNRTLQRDVQLTVWVARHVDVAPGTIDLRADSPVWLPGGSRVLHPGRHSLASLVEQSDAERLPGEPMLDVWCETLEAAEEESWAAAPPATDAEAARLANQVERYVRTVLFLEEALPACHAWLTDATRVAIPLRGDGDTFRSCSHPGVPGMVELDLLAEDQILEALVHESAHQFLFRMEATGPLVDPAHHGTYRSPLRPEPRPLRGILLAYHALAYIAALYHDLSSIPLVARWGGAELGSRRELAIEAGTVLAANTRHLTADGRAFLDATSQVLEYSTP